MSITRTRSAGGPSRNAPGSSAAPRTRPGDPVVGSGCRERERLARPRGDPAAGHDECRVEALEALQQDEVRAVAGGDHAQVAQPVVARRVQRGHEQRVLGRDAFRPRSGGTSRRDALRGPACRAPGRPSRTRVLGAVAADEFEQRAQVARVGRLADQRPATPPLLQRLLPRRRLVVRPDAGGHVGVERAAGDARSVPVDVLVEPTFSSTAGSPAMTAGKSITSATQKAIRGSTST